MSNSGDTCSISATYDFLSAADDSSLNIKGAIKKSASDSGLLNCMEKNMRNAEKTNACLCSKLQNGNVQQAIENGDVSRELPNSDVVQEDDRRHGCQCLRNKADLKVNGVAEEGCISGVGEHKAKPEVPTVRSTSTSDEKNSAETDCVTLKMASSCEDTATAENADQNSATNNSSKVDRLLKPDDGIQNQNGEVLCEENSESCGQCASEVPKSENSEADSGSSVHTHVNKDEENGGEVMMRPDRKLLNRRSTNTGIISSAFGFLPPTDSVFLPDAVKESPRSSDLASALQECEEQETTHHAHKDLDKNESEGLSAVEDNLGVDKKCEEKNPSGMSNSAAEQPQTLCENKCCETSEASSVNNSTSLTHTSASSSQNDKEDGCETPDTSESDSSSQNAVKSDNSPSVQCNGTVQGSSDVTVRITSATSEEEGAAEVRMRKPRLSKQDSITEEDGSGDSSDEDAGVYAESFRRSNWIRVDDNGELELAFPAVETSRLSTASRSSATSTSRSSATSRSSSLSTDLTDGLKLSSPKVTSDEPPVFPEKCPSPRLYHKRSDSTSTTLSEREFKKEYISRRKCLIQRRNSSKEYHRFSAKVYDDEKSVVLEKAADETDFGLHILDSEPAYITKVDPGSAADRAGVEEGQILVAVNGSNVLSLSHLDIVSLITNNPAVVTITVATSDFQPSRDLQASILEGYMQKLGGNSSVIMRRWKRRYFILRQDSCLYYYKQRDDADPLGAIPLAGYTFSRHLDGGRDYCFKAEKYGARTYYFMTESRDDMTEWVGSLSEAAARSKKRKDSFVSVTSHNVGLPALEVRRPECTGYLQKMGDRHKTWRRRYCVLKDACLYYYKNMNSLNALGVAHLHGYKVDPSINISKKHAFGVFPPDETLRTFQFSADNETDRQRWVDAMIRSIQRWIQIDNDC